MSISDKTDSAREVLKGEKGLTKKYFSEKTYPSEAAAKEAFGEAKNRMYNADAWGKIPGPENATFIFYNEKGFPYETSEAAIDNFKPRVGDFIKTLLPGPLPENWVQVTDIQQGSDHASFTVRPGHDPADKNSP